MAYLVEKRRSAFRVLRVKGVWPWSSSAIPQSRAVKVVMAYLLEKEEVRPSSPKKERGMTMVLRRRG